MVRAYSVYAFCRLFVRDAIFPHVIHVERSIATCTSRYSLASYVWKPERSCMYDSLMESEKKRRERLKRRNQRDRDRHAAESAQQRQAQLARRRVRDRAHCVLRSAAHRERVFGLQEWAISVQTRERVFSSKWALRNMQMRLTHETTDHREARLEQMSIAQKVRLTNDTPPVWLYRKCHKPTPGCHLLTGCYDCTQTFIALKPWYHDRQKGSGWSVSEGLWCITLYSGWSWTTSTYIVPTTYTLLKMLLYSSIETLQQVTGC